MKKLDIDFLLEKIKYIIENKKWLYIFAENKNKFEWWLKIEIIDILLEMEFKDIVPEKQYKKQHIDITFDNWEIELKTVNTNYKNELIKNITRPITKNIDWVIKDIEDLKVNEKYKNKAVLFVVFPLFEDNVKFFEKKYLVRMEKITWKKIDYKKGFSFKLWENKISSIIYFWKI